MRSIGIKTYLAAGVLCLAVFGAYCAVQASGEDQTLVFTREVPTSLPPETLNQSIGMVPLWTNWFYTVGQAERIDIMGRALPLSNQKPVQGALIRLEIQPHRGEHRGSFDLLLKVADYVPGKFVTLKLAQDQTGRITRLFDSLEWKIEFLPGVIRGTETAHTSHWRSRLFAALSQRILMNQLFYPDLMALGQFTQPLSPNPYPAYGP
jgi:hypothetical protein